MTKTELMETYTAEQLADMVVKANNLMDMLKYSDSFLKSGLFENPAVAAFESKINIMQHENDRLQSEVEKYRKAFQDAKKERDCKICEYQNKVDELKGKLEIQTAATKYAEEYVNSLKNELDRSQNTITQLDEILSELFGVTHDAEKPNEFKDVLRDKAKGNISDFLPTEPIKVADMLINTKGEYEHSSIAKAFCRTDKGTYRIFDVSELRQIAEHLLVYCNHYKEEEE